MSPVRALRHRVQLGVALALAFAACGLVGLLVMPAASLAAANANFVGYWEDPPALGYAPFSITSENFATGECVGSSPGFLLTGCKVTGQAYEFVIETEGGGYRSFNKGTIEGNKATGSFNDGTEQEHPYTATRLLNLTGTWVAVYHCESGECKGRSFPAIDTLSQAEGPSPVTGANETESISGTVSGQTFEFHSSAGEYKTEATLIVSEDGLSWKGPLQDSKRTSGTYTATRLPSVSSVSPSSGSTLGGTAVTITGGGFSTNASVSFGSSPASSVTVNSTGSIAATSPAGAGTVDVTVTTTSGTSATTPGDRFTYVEPAAPVTSLPAHLAEVTPAPGPPSLPVPAPRLGVTGNVAPVSGTVLVRVPPSTTFVPLASLRQIPFGSVIDATHGRVSVTTAAPHGGTQTGEFFEGEFVLTQGANGLVVATLTGGSFSVCPTARERAHKARASAASASGKHVVRKLWADAHGSFSTKGNYAAGAVAGTEWLTEDLCDGTLIRVTRDKVAVTNLVNHRHVMVKVGHGYLAKAP
jgi:IPT/TIG domain-containing protein